MEMVEVITMHGRGAGGATARVCEVLAKGRTVFLLPDKTFYGSMR